MALPTIVTVAEDTLQGIPSSNKEASNGFALPVPALRPEIILMDEPCSALDPLSTLKIEDLTLKLKEKYTVVIVTHNMQQAQRIADKTIFMYLGEVIEAGDAKKIFENPENELTANCVRGKFG